MAASEHRYLETLYEQAPLSYADVLLSDPTPHIIGMGVVFLIDLTACQHVIALKRPTRRDLNQSYPDKYH